MKPNKYYDSILSNSLYYTVVNTIIGKLMVFFNNKYLTLILFEKEIKEVENHKYFKNLINDTNYNNIILKNFLNELKLYFIKKLEYFNTPTMFFGTNFQKNVWQNLKKISYGKTISYKNFTENNFNKNQLRAVSSQIGKNPLPIIFPCHRIIGSNGNLTGFSGGLKIKEYLLNLESSNNIKMELCF